MKKTKEAKIEEATCESCKGTGRGPLNGVYETTCEICNGSGK